MAFGSTFWEEHRGNVPEPWGRNNGKGDLVDQVAMLAYSEPVRVESEQLDGLYSQLGTSGAEDVVCRAMEEIALRMNRMLRQFVDQELEDLRKNARSLVAISQQIGLIGLADVAGDVTKCIDDGDQVALAAVVHRFVRVGDRSLSAIWDLQDISI
jgi:hypothetical protein